MRKEGTDVEASRWRKIDKPSASPPGFDNATLSGSDSTLNQASIGSERSGIWSKIFGEEVFQSSGSSV